MGLRINSNVVSTQAQNRLAASSKKLNTSLERLSTGLRINSGKDDVVGLLKSESLRTQIRGISAAQGSLNNAQSLLGIAEGSLAQLTEISQALREKVLQAADSSLSSTDRTNLTTAVTDLLNEYSRLSGAAEFDSVKLLTGTFTNKSFQVGPNVSDTLSISITDSRSSNVGKVAVLTSVTTFTRVTGSSATAATLTDPSGITINGTTVASSAFTSDGVSNVEASESAIAYVNAINSVSGTSGVRADVLSNVVTFSDYTGGASISASTTITLNGVSIANASGYANTDAGATSLVTAINAVTTQTGVTAAIDTTNNVFTLTASDGRNISLFVGAAVTVSDATGYLATNMASGSQASVYRGTFKLYSDNNFTLTGGAVSATTSVTQSTAFTLNTLDVSTSTNAANGVFVLDNVIRQLQQRRTEVGSKSNRIDFAINELNTRLENYQSAESVIRNTDVAAETANLTSAQILQQAGVSVLQRANAIPQIALQLLQQ